MQKNFTLVVLAIVVVSVVPVVIEVRSIRDLASRYWKIRESTKRPALRLNLWLDLLPRRAASAHPFFPLIISCVLCSHVPVSAGISDSPSQEGSCC